LRTNASSHFDPLLAKKKALISRTFFLDIAGRTGKARPGSRGASSPTFELAEAVDETCEREENAVLPGAS